MTPRIQCWPGVLKLDRHVEVFADLPNVKMGGLKGVSKVVQLSFHQPKRILVFSNIQTDAYIQGLPHVSAPRSGCMFSPISSFQTAHCGSTKVVVVRNAQRDATYNAAYNATVKIRCEANVGFLKYPDRCLCPRTASYKRPFRHAAATLHQCYSENKVRNGCWFSPISRQMFIS